MGVMMGGCGMIPKVCKILGLIWYRPKQKHEKENGKRKLKPKMGNENGKRKLKPKMAIYYSLIQNGCDEDTAKELMSTGTLQDIEDYIEVEEVLYAY